MKTNSKEFRVLVIIDVDSSKTLSHASYRSSFASCCKYVSLCQRNLYPRQCHTKYYIQRKDPFSDSFITISCTDFSNTDLPF